MRQNAFHDYGHWWKGNTHTHTTRSDGSLTTTEIADSYASHGYDFLAVTDHRIYNHDVFLKKGLLILPAVEGDVLVNKLGLTGCHHMVGLGLHPTNADAPYARSQVEEQEGLAANGQALCNYLRDHDCAVIYAHPNWSRMEPEDLSSMDGYFALEVYNNICDTLACGYSETHWDALLRRGRKIFAVASDDTHAPQHRFGGWVMVNAPELTQQSILENLLDGNFYATTGPEIQDFYVENEVAHVKCSPAKRVDFVTFNRWGGKVEDSCITDASFKLNMTEFQYVRAVVTDANGKKAWTNPIFKERK